MMRPMTIWERRKAHREGQELARRATQTIAEGLSYCTLSIASVLVVELSGAVRNFVVERSGSYSPSLSECSIVWRFAAFFACARVALAPTQVLEHVHADSVRLDYRTSARACRLPTRA